MVYRIYSEKKQGFDNEARALTKEIREILGITGVENIRLLNRYDVEGVDEALFELAVKTVFSEPQMDNTSKKFDPEGAYVFAVEYLPGQFDQRADSASQCIQLISQKERPLVRTAKVYAVSGVISDDDVAAIKRFLINPVEAREAALDVPETLKMNYAMPDKVKTLEGFTKLDRAGLSAFVKEYALAMDDDDIAFCQQYFISEKRDPTVTEIRMIDTYWSDHCRHTTFLTTVDSIEFEDEDVERAYERYITSRKMLGREKPINLMDIATLAVKHLKKEGKLDKLDESDEINACTVKFTVNIDGKDEKWLLLFKNETHNHPTEIEPFGGAATCIGGAIRDPLSGRSYVYAAMRVTGAADPTIPVSETIKGKLPQRKIVTTAAAGYSSYGNQIGLATGRVDELYHPGYAAKRLEIGAVIGAAPEENVRRECPAPGDVVVLIGGRTGRDGCGGATGSSKSHTESSLTSCGAEVQKGNAPEERKLQRLFRNKEATLMIKRCNDFGAGGVSVAIGELADGLLIELDKVPKKYEGLDGTELAISESQERMATVIAPSDVEAFIALAESENLEATPVATVTESPRLVMKMNGDVIVDISREFLNSNGAEKHITAKVRRAEDYKKSIPADFEEGMKALVSDLNVCSKRGLAERFDSTIGTGTVLMPFGGKNQLTPSQAMAHLVSVEHGLTDTTTFMAWGGNPYVLERSPYHGAYLAVVESISKLIASGAEFKDVYLTFQEYFCRLGKDPERWGLPVAALLGAFDAQLDLGCGAIGGKDSMSGTFENIDVPPTLVSFAVTAGKANEAKGSEFKKSGSKTVLLSPKMKENGLPDIESLVLNYGLVYELLKSGKALSARTVTFGGVAEAIYKMCIGNGIGFEFDGVTLEDIFSYNYGSFVLEMNEDINVGKVIGKTVSEEKIVGFGKELELNGLSELYENKLEGVYACNIKVSGKLADIANKEHSTLKAPVTVAKPRVLIPVFPGTNCEYDTARAFERAGAKPEIFVIRNLTASAVAESVDAFAKACANAEIIFIPGGFSGGDEPEGSGKFITAFFRNAAVREATEELLDKRMGLMGGICNGFQALVKLGLVPFGRITDTDETCPTLTYNDIGRHQSKMVDVKVASVKSPWLSLCEAGDIYKVAISHGEGKFVISDELMQKLAKNGQIMTQYVDPIGAPTMDIQYNPNGSAWAIEGILSPDGRIFGKMGHTERYCDGLYANVPGNYDMKLFESAVRYFK